MFSVKGSHSTIVEDQSLACDIVVTGQAVPAVSEGCGAFIFSIKQYKKDQFLDCITLKIKEPRYFTTSRTTHPMTQQLTRKTCNFNLK
jgi:hypothetical protein